LPVEAHAGIAEVEVVPADRDRLRDPAARADQEPGELAVVVGAGVDVRGDLVQAQEIHLRWGLGEPGDGGTGWR
jgi:hypothetical protein